MSWSGDALRDFDRHDREQERRLNRYPKCKYCDQRITGDFVFVFDGDCMCEECLNEEHRQYVDDYMENEVFRYLD